MKFVIIITRKGLIKRYPVADIRPSGRGAQGVKGVTLTEGDEVAGMSIVDMCSDVADTEGTKVDTAETPTEAPASD